MIWSGLQSYTTAAGSVFPMMGDPAAPFSLMISLYGSDWIKQTVTTFRYTSVSQFRASGPIALHVFDVSFLHHTWFKWIAPYQATAELDDSWSFESGVVEEGNIENMQSGGSWGPELRNTEINCHCLKSAAPNVGNLRMLYWTFFWHFRDDLKASHKQFLLVWSKCVFLRVCFIPGRLSLNNSTLRLCKLHLAYTWCNY